MSKIPMDHEQGDRIISWLRAIYLITCISAAVVIALLGGILAAVTS